MSIIRDETIRLIGQNIGIDSLHQDVVQVLAPDVEIRLRQVIDQAVKFAAHGKRRKLTTSDINDALRTRNLEGIYGFQSYEEPAPLIEKQGIFFNDDPQVDLAELLRPTIPPCPIEPNFRIHWLAVEGVQPTIPENDVVEEDTEAIEDKDPQDREQKPLVKHVLSDEMQLYYKKVTSAIKSNDPELQQSAFASLANDTGLHQLLPYLCRFIYNQVVYNNDNLTLLGSILRTASCLLANQSLHIELYLHQLLPAILTCVVGKRLCQNPTDNHWALREHGARLVSQICKRFGGMYHNLQPRISKTFYEAFTSPSTPLTTTFGAILGIMYLGPLSMELLLFPSVASYLEKLDPALARSNPNQVQRLEAQQCFGILVHATGRYLQTNVGNRTEWIATVVQDLYSSFGESLIPYVAGVSPNDCMLDVVV